MVGEDEEMSDGSRSPVNGSSDVEPKVFNGFNLNDSRVNDISLNGMGTAFSNNKDLSLLRFEVTDNDDLFGDRPMPEWVSWGDRLGFQAGRSSTNPFVDQSNVTVTENASADSVPNGIIDPIDSSPKSVPSLFEEDVEFVGVELEGTEQALKEGIVGEAGPLKRNVTPIKLEKEDSDDGGAGIEFNDSNYWKVDQEVTVLE